jgi:hypothetical protein
MDHQALKDFAGPVATIFAAIAALSVTGYFAWHQKKIAEQKLRFDLFERRFAIFDSIFDFYNALIAWKGTEADGIARQRFFRAYQEARFLFSRESQIETLMGEMNVLGNKVIAHKEHPELLEGDPILRHKVFMDVQKAQTVDFEDRFLRLRDAIGEYLNFHRA